MSEDSVETVSWINIVPHNRREKIARWWVESIREQHSYISKRELETDFFTRISVDQIEQLASQGLRRALFEQKQQLESDDSWLTMPRATVDGEQYLGSVLLPRRPLGVRFTERGVVPLEQ